MPPLPHLILPTSLDAKRPTAHWKFMPDENPPITRSVRCKVSQLGVKAMALISLLNPRFGEGAVFTNRR
jgi:hypothetical protein